jgi:large conductance mechanosensitive channel
MSGGVRQLWKEFKGFALKGNVIDLAVAVVIGNAFGAVVNSLVKDVVMPLLSYVQSATPHYQELHIGRVKIGSFLGDLLNFALIAVVMFLIVVKLVGTVRKAVPFLDEDEPATKQCPYCLSNIPFRASRCAQCTSELPGAKNAD